MIPDFLFDLLLKQYESELTNKIIDGYLKKRKVTLRINKLKTTKEEIKNLLKEENIQFEEISWYDEALIIKNVDENVLKNLKIYQEGKIYLQSLSSMIPPIILNPKEKESILDMAAAPGGKTTQIYNLTNGMALITAVEKNKIRSDRLKYNLQKQGATRVSVLNSDALKLDDYFSFDKILLDAPCSGSGTLYIKEGKLESVFSKELIYNSAKIQEQLLKKAVKLLKSNHEMVYSTCSILEEENEKILLKVLKTENIEIVPIDTDLLKDIPLLPTKVKGTVCVCPNELYEGFFIAKLRKK